jgi:hypothetical protein
VTIQRFAAIFFCFLSITAPGLGADDSESSRPRGTHGPQITASLAKLFGSNTAFTAELENQVHLGSGGDTMIIPGKIAFDSGKSSFEMNLSEVQGTQLSPQARNHMKASGMDTIVRISRPDKKAAYVVYPGLSAYTEISIEDPAQADTNLTYSVKTVKLDTETVDGHECVKNKVIVTSNKGENQESTVWNATDLNDFPIKIETTERGQSRTMLFKNVSLSKPASSLFDPPSGFERYKNEKELIQGEIMKRAKALGLPPPQL